MQESILYRNKALNKVVIDITVHYDHRDKVILANILFKSDREKFNCQLHFFGFPRNYETEEMNIFLGSALKEATNLAKWMVLNGSYKIYAIRRYQEPSTIFISPYDEDKGKVDYQYSINIDEKTIAIHHSPLQTLFVEESKLARKVIIAEMYSRQSVSEDDMIKLAHFPEPIIQREFNSLRKSEYAASLAKEEGWSSLNAEHLGSTCLTTKGREYYENMIGAAIGTVFIIAACRAQNKGDDQAHQNIISQYKEIIRDEGYEPIFQEHEEPKKNIYIDIFDYIDTCEFVIADITYDRPNCYVEIGYALASGKHIMGFMQREYFEEKGAGNKIPFDLFPVKFQEYDKGMVAEIEKYLRERIRVLRNRKSL